MNQITIPRSNILKNTLFLTICIMFMIVEIIFVYSSLQELFDFGSFIASGQLANEGNNPYENNSDLIFHISFGEIIPDVSAPNLNPPISVLIFSLLARLDPATTIQLWRLVSFLLYIFMIILLCRYYRDKSNIFPNRVLWAICLAGFWHTIQLGQIYILMFVFATMAWIFLEREKEIPAGLCLGFLIALKPNFVFWAILLLVLYKWKAFFISGFTALGISILPIIKYGPIIYLQWLDATTNFTKSLLVFPGNNSFQGLFARIGSTNVGIAVGVILATIVILYLLLNKKSVREINSLGIIISMLISPIAWTGYTILCVPIFFSSKSLDWRIIIAGILLIIPFPVVLGYFVQSEIFFIFFGWLYGWALLLILSVFIGDFPTNLHAYLKSKLIYK